MLRGKLSDHLSVLLGNSVEPDDERHVALSAGSIECAMNIIYISHVEEQGSQPDQLRGRLCLFPFQRADRVAQIEETRNHRSRWHHLFEHLDPLAIQIPDG